MSFDREIWVTGIGLLTSLGEGVESNFEALCARINAASSNVTGAMGAYPVHALCSVDLAAYVSARAELRQMGRWQRIGVHAAALALADAGVPSKSDILDRMHLAVAAGNGERDIGVDAEILAGLRTAEEAGPYLNDALARGLRPTLYLGELSNLLAGNIQILLKVTGSSRTFKGEETAGLACVEDAWRRIGAGQAEIALVGGALNAEREDLLLGYELGCNLWSHPHASVWERAEAGGGFVPGSAGVFLVLESATHARTRGAEPYARIASVASDHSRRAQGAAARALGRLIDSACAGRSSAPLAVLSGASGVEPATGEELAVLRDRSAAVRAYGSVFGHTVEAHLPLGVALGAMALRHGSLYPPFDRSGLEKALDEAPDDIFVTSLGHWRGEGVVKLDRVAAEAKR